MAGRRAGLLALGLTLACASSAAPRATAPSRIPAITRARVTAAALLMSTWPTYHHDSARSGDAGASVPALTGALHAAWSARLDGAVYGAAVLLGSTAIVATEHDSVYALDVGTGRVRWRRHLGEPVPRSSLPCGNIDPLGITGTPAYDAATGSLFVVGETTGAHHTLFALTASTGVVRWARSLDVQPTRQRAAQQQRGAVLLARGRAVVAFGGLYGDCGNYVGYVSSVPTSGQGATTTFTIPTVRGAGIWAPPGPVLGPGGLVDVASGNGAATSGRWDGSDSVVALDPVTMRRSTAFVPSSWGADNAADLDLGSSSPVPVGGQLVMAGKRGTVYLLSSTLRALTSRSGCAAYGGAAFRGSTVYLPCTAGVRALHVGTGSLSWGWTASGIPGSPVLAGGVAYALAPARRTFYELALTTGQVLRSFTFGASITRFATPTVAASGRLVLVPTGGGLVAIT